MGFSRFGFSPGVLTYINNPGELSEVIPRAGSSGAPPQPCSLASPPQVPRPRPQGRGTRGQMPRNPAEDDSSRNRAEWFPKAMQSLKQNAFGEIKAKQSKEKHS